MHVRTAEFSVFHLLRNGTEIEVEIVQNENHNSEERDNERLKINTYSCNVVNTLYNSGALSYYYILQCPRLARFLFCFLFL